jgi:hypothetical protein
MRQCPEPLVVLVPLPAESPDPELPLVRIPMPRRGPRLWVAIDGMERVVGANPHSHGDAAPICEWATNCQQRGAGHDVFHNGPEGARAKRASCQQP